MTSAETSSPVVLNGGCCCKKVRFTSTTLPEYMTNCFCVQCRKIAGAPYITLANFPRSSITWTTEPPKYYHSSSFGRRGFCGQCGSTLTFESDKTPERMCIAPGSFDDWEVKGEFPKIDDYTFVEEKPVWFDIPNDGVKRLIGFGPEEADQKQK